MAWLLKYFPSYGKITPFEYQPKTTQLDTGHWYQKILRRVLHQSTGLHHPGHPILDHRRFDVCLCEIILKKKDSVLFRYNCQSTLSIHRCITKFVSIITFPILTGLPRISSATLRTFIYNVSASCRLIDIAYRSIEIWFLAVSISRSHYFITAGAGTGCAWIKRYMNIEIQLLFYDKWNTIKYLLEIQII